MYWALSEECALSPTGRSSKLIAEPEDDALPYVPRWRFVGVAEWDEIPGHIRKQATAVPQERKPHGDPPLDQSEAGVPLSLSSAVKPVD